MKQSIARDEKLLQDNREYLKELEAELAAARLREWYAANPGIELAVGDELTTDDGDIFYHFNIEAGNPLVYRPCHVEKIYVEGAYCYCIIQSKVHRYGITQVSMPLARRMRQAWLQEATDDNR